ncbi:murein biosynthesis integral membrane protein MurJ [Corynebacterium casei]|uniref:murein biosynthesis integral membrane protein MurJ n=1 Tax=Corynebacterium casei TaxID=160386 RepID=UPI003FD59BC2
MDDKPKSLSSTEKQDQPVSPSNPVSPSLNEEQAAATAAAAADLPALNGQLDSRPISRPEVVPEPGLEDASQAEQEASESDASNGAESGAGSVGLRQRIVKPSPPAPVPALKKPVPVPPAVEDKSTLKSAQAENASDRDVVRATGSMAVATLLSRITGFIRNVLIGSSLGAAIASAFTTANQLPNLITEIVLGAVLTSLVVPVLVRAEKEDADHGEAFVRRLFTLAVTLLGGITLLSIIFAPQLTEMMLPETGQVNTTQATSFAYLLLPQIFFYGLFALFQAVLNTKHIFGPAAWAPVINNFISIAVLLAYQFVPGQLHPAEPSPVVDPHVLLLGVGTTLGVIVQCAILLPFIKKAGINLKPLWGVDARLKQFGSMAVAIVAYVAISQFGYVVTSRIGALADEAAPFTYQQAWLLLQVPYGIIGVTLLTAIMPRLSRNAADGDVKAVVRDLTLGTKLTFIALIPIVIFMTAFGVPIARGLFQYNEFSAENAELLGLTLSFSAFTLIPYALVLLHLRVFYAREEAWIPTYIIAGTIFTKVVLTMLSPFVAGSPERVVILLAASNGFGFIAGAVIGAFLLRRKLGNLGGKEVMATTYWAVGASVVGLIPAALLMWVMNMLLPDPAPTVAYLVMIAVIGVVFVAVTGIVLGRSNLPEVVNLGRALQRIPGVSRVIRVRTEDGINVEAPEVAEIQPIYGLDAFNSSPVPPPMSAGIVRGPRLVPGAPVSDGRFRLLSDCGSVPGARFWQAREQDTGRTVALTFVDTTSQAPLAPAPPAEAARRSALVSRNTRKLAELNLDTMPTRVEILGYRSGCLVVADWVEGSDLATVAESGSLDPHAVARALAPLMEDSTTAHTQGLAVGIDNRSRIRISTDGVAVLAFPAVLNEATEETDRKSLSSALRLLVDATLPTPQVLEELAAKDSDKSLEDIAAGLRAYAPLETDEEEEQEPIEALPVTEEPLAREDIPEETAGFGARNYSSSSAIIIGISVIFFVVLMAALTTWVTSLIGQDSTANPVTTGSQESTTAEAPTLATAPPVMLPMKAAIEVPSGKIVPEAVDEDRDTEWTADETGVGIVVTSENSAQLHDVLISHQGSNGAEVVIYGANAADFVAAQFNAEEHTQLGKGTLSRGRTAIDLDEDPTSFDSVIIWVKELPKSDKVDLTEVQLTGVITGTASTDNPEEAVSEEE